MPLPLPTPHAPLAPRHAPPPTDYLEAYTNHMPGAIRAHVDAVRNCEDLAMALLVGAATGGRPPAFVHSARAVDLGKGLTKVKGISSGKKHGDVSAGGSRGAADRDVVLRCGVVAVGAFQVFLA